MGDGAPTRSARGRGTGSRIGAVASADRFAARAQGDRARASAGTADPDARMRIRELIAQHGSPLWLADIDRFASNLRAFETAWSERWPRTGTAYSYKTNRLLAFLHAAEAAGASPEVVCGAEYELATGVVEADP